MAEILTYSGRRLTQKLQLPDGTELKPYLPDQRLREAVNLAIILGKPLLIKGEPGCGKTKLAVSVAFELFERQLLGGDIRLEDVYFEWHVKSSSKAVEGLYRYDYIERLQHAQLNQIDAAIKMKPEIEYVKKGPLGLAFEQTHTLNQRVVVLIDEIDKADPDFPNDLLRELDELKYTIEEVSDPALREQSANLKKPPIVFITSNDQKALPPAFLRRCLFYHIDFPKEDKLRDILVAHFRESNQKESLIADLAAKIYKTRIRMEREKEEREKKISTSELIDWCEILLRHDEEKILELLSGELPYAAVLFKNKEDFRFSKAHLSE